MKTTLLAILLAFTLNAAATVDEGVEAFNQGKYSDAVKLLEPHKDDAVAQRYLALMYDENYHVIWQIEKPKGGHPVYNGGIDFDNKTMLKHYKQAIKLGDLISRYHFCSWKNSVFWEMKSYVRGSKCKHVQRHMEEFVQARDPDPRLAYYHWLVNSGELGTGDRRLLARDLALPPARAGDHFAQFYLGEIYFGHNARNDRPRDHANAFAWYSASARGGNYRARAMQAFLRERLEANGEYACVEAYTLALLNEIASEQAGKPTNDTANVDRCNPPFTEHGTWSISEE